MSERACSRCKFWVRGFEAMKNPSRAMHGCCYVDGGNDIEDCERTHYSDSCEKFEAKSISRPVPPDAQCREAPASGPTSNPPLAGNPSAATLSQRGGADG